MSTESSNFDIFLSYNWDVKDKVKNLYNKLTNDCNLKVCIIVKFNLNLNLF
jgi:hypothetical protein